jgi:hypothetical protein
MTKAALKDQVDRNMLSYVDGIVVASRKRDTYISNLAETFMNMCEARLKLNPEKCIFGVTGGRVLGSLVSTKISKQSPTRSKPSLRCGLRRIDCMSKSSQAE